MSAIKPGQPVDRARVVHRRVVGCEPRAADGSHQAPRPATSRITVDVTAVGADAGAVALGALQVGCREPHDGSSTGRQLAEVVTIPVDHEEPHSAHARTRARIAAMVAISAESIGMQPECQCGADGRATRVSSL